MPKVSIVVPSRGGASRLPVLFGALRQQSLQDFEVIVVIDGDIDDSESVVAQEAARGVLNIRSIVFPENRGRVAALNAGFDSADGEVLVRCDDDFEPRTNYVARHYELHQGESPVGVVGIASNVYQDSAYAASYGEKAEEKFHAAAHALPADERWRYWAGNVSVTRETFDRVGPYDRDFRAYGWEDVEWGYRLHQAGVPIVIDQELSTPHHLAATSTRKRADRAFQSGAARRRFIAKHPEALSTKPLERTPWNAAVTCVSIIPRSGVLALAAGVDRVLPKVPSAVGEKLAALIVEGSVQGGQRARAKENHAI